MKRNKIYIVAAVLVLLTSSNVFATYHAIGIGSGGDADAGSITVEIGDREVAFRDRTYIVSVGIPVIYHGDDNIPAGTLDKPTPHDDFTRLGTRNDGTEIGLLGKLGIPVYDSKGYVSGILGLTRANTVDLAQSNPSGEFYVQSTGTKMHGIYGLSFGYFPEIFEWKLQMNLQLDIDNRRGITGYVGWCW